MTPKIRQSHLSRSKHAARSGCVLRLPRRAAAWAQKRSSGPSRAPRRRCRSRAWDATKKGRGVGKSPRNGGHLPGTPLKIWRSFTTLLGKMMGKSSRNGDVYNFLIGKMVGKSFLEMEVFMQNPRSEWRLQWDNHGNKRDHGWEKYDLWIKLDRWDDEETG